MSLPLSVLIIEDSEDDAALLIRELQRSGYHIAAERVDTRDAMIAALEKRQWHLIICDYSLPGFSGGEALQLLRQRDAQIPFIFVSGTIGEETAVAALKQGAQDYLMKNNLRRLLPAVQRELREVELQKERQRLEQQVQQLQKFEAIGRLAGGVAHDFNNALGVIVGWAELGYEEAPAGSSLKAKFQTILEQSSRASALTRQLLAFARRQVLQPRNLDLNDLVATTINLLQSVMREDIEVKVIPAADLDVIRADPTQIEQVLMNLCLNARDAMPHSGTLVIKTSNLEITEPMLRIHSYSRLGRFVLLSVSDTGVGMDKATLDRIFEPFFTTKEIGRGTGLGLATVYGIVKQHDGFINVYSELGQGTTFHLYFPVHSGTAEVREKVESENAAGGQETILLAEDHAELRELARHSLSARGYRVITASNGEEALRLFILSAQQIQLVVLDVVMPGLSGPEVYSRIRAIKPGIAAIFTTGHAAESGSLNASLANGAVFLQKPYSPKSLARIVRHALDR